MSKQLMIYDDIQPLSDKHRKWSVGVTDFGFVSHLSSVPVLVNEIPFAATEFPIIFSPTAVEGEFIPLAMMGLKQGQNLFLNENNVYTGNYVPAFIRRYPFVLGTTEEVGAMAVCIDENSSAFDHDGVKGYRLFADDGEQTEEFKGIVEFLKDYQYRGEMTKLFCKRLYELDLFEPMKANISFKNKAVEDINLTGFYAIKYEKLKSLTDLDVLELFKKDALEVIYAHLQSLARVNDLIARISKK